MNKHDNRISTLKEFLDSGTQKARITQVALCVLAVASMPALIFVAAAMGNAVQLFRQFDVAKKFNDKQIKRAMYHLRQERLIEYVTERSGKSIVRITRKGKNYLRAFTIDLIQIKKPAKWDGKWRLVMFDIPIRFTKGREALRFHLKELDFYQFQKSAWIYPYPCEDEIIFIANFYGIGKYVEVLTVDSMLREVKAKKHFKL